jgi:hypothetical protein
MPGRHQGSGSRPEGTKLRWPDCELIYYIYLIYYPIYYITGFFITLSLATLLIVIHSPSSSSASSCLHLVSLDSELRSVLEVNEDDARRICKGTTEARQPHALH